MNKKCMNSKEFARCVEAFLNGTIGQEQSDALLRELRQNPERLKEFTAQLQTDRLLKIRAQQPDSSLADQVLELIRLQNGHAESPFAPGIRKRTVHRVLPKLAAGLFLALGIGFLVNYSICTAPQRKTEESTFAVKSRIDTAHTSDIENETPQPAYKPAETKPIKQEQLASGQLEVKKEKPQVEEQLVRTRQISVSADRLNESDSFDGFGFAAAPLAKSIPESMPMPVVPPAGESYAHFTENRFMSVKEKPLSTFSIDVDTASYSNVRRFLNNGQRPPQDAVRIEEMINYFTYDYTPPKDNAPFSAAMALHECPWNRDHQLLRIGLQGRTLEQDQPRNSNLVFLIDASGSMSSANKLPLLKKGFQMLVESLSENDRIAIVAYAGSSGLVLDSTPASDKTRIIQALDRLRAGGSTAGGAGIELAYRVAADHFIKGGANRIILATDGDFNVGVSSHDGLQKLIEEKRKSGIFLSVLGFGQGNLQDSKMELLANKGNGNYFYIDSEREAGKVLVRQLNSTLVTIAKDVKVQIEFNPAQIASYRLIGYENRKMTARDFADDTKDAGEIGAGHQVTALYELIPAGVPVTHDGVPLKYAEKDEPAETIDDGELLTLKLRYKKPDGETSRLLEFPLLKSAFDSGAGDECFRWATAVAAFGQMLRHSEYVKSITMKDIRALAESAQGEDKYGERAEFLDLLDRAAAMPDTGTDGSDGKYPTWQYRN